MLIAALTISTVAPIATFIAVYRRAATPAGSVGLVLACFLWGGVASALAAHVNPAAVHGGLTDHNTMMRLSAPVTEELFKALLLLYLIRRRSCSYVGDGAVYGFAVGIGFAVVENLQYIMVDPGAELRLLAVRVVSTNLVQASASASVGMALGLGRLQASFSRRVWLFLGGLTLASSLQAAFNNLVTRVAGNALPVFAVLTGLGSLSLILLAIRCGQARRSAQTAAGVGSRGQEPPTT